MEAFFSFLYLIFWLCFIFLIGLMWWKIASKAGYHGAWGILMLIPIANIFMLAILAFREWPIHKELKSKGIDLKISAPLPTAMVVVMVICAVLFIGTLLAAIAIPNFLKVKASANEAAAKSSIRTIVNAVEAYSSENNGKYPAGEDELKKYLSGPYDNTVQDGYSYSLYFDKDLYRITAIPEICGTTGTKVFLAENNGVISEKNCE